MLARKIVLGGITCASFIIPVTSYAATIEAEMAAKILDLKSLSAEELKDFCEGEPQVRHCDADIVRDRIEKKQVSNDNRIIRYATYHYPVYNTNLE